MFLVSAPTDRFYALWVLEAASGMRRCELAGARRDQLDLERGTLWLNHSREYANPPQQHGEPSPARHENPSPG
jgi:integrase